METKQVKQEVEGLEINQGKQQAVGSLSDENKRRLHYLGDCMHARAREETPPSYEEWLRREHV